MLPNERRRQPRTHTSQSEPLPAPITRLPGNCATTTATTDPPKVCLRLADALRLRPASFAKDSNRSRPRCRHRPWLQSGPAVYRLGRRTTQRRSLFGGNRCVLGFGVGSDDIEIKRNLEGNRRKGNGVVIHEPIGGRRQCLAGPRQRRQEACVGDQQPWARASGGFRRKERDRAAGVPGQARCAGASSAPAPNSQASVNDGACRRADRLAISGDGTVRLAKCFVA